MKIAGIEPRAVADPRNVDELAAVVGELYAAGKPFAFVGGGTDLELGNAPRALDTIVKTGGCAAVIDYAPEDQTITVEAGMTVAELGAVLAENRQFLPLDVTDPDRTTVGGAVATNAYGRRRLRFGSIKDNIVGIGIVRPDGTRAHGGGKVVKNVAGFDLPKLMVGALGTLGAIVSATFRVHPIDRHAGGVALRDLTVEDVTRLCDEVVGEALVPSSVAAYDGTGSYECVIAFEGFRRGVEEQIRAATAIAQRLRLAAVPCDAADLQSFEQRERRVRSSGEWRVAFGAAPSGLAQFLSSGETRGRSSVYYPLFGAAFVSADTLHAQDIARWRAALDGGTVVVAAMPASARGAVDCWGAPPASLPLMRRLKNNFDPKGLCNPGRFVGGL